ncbi:MAG: hypothetical protein ACRENQ_15155 [Gemmatimonadaceae bacterium]
MNIFKAYPSFLVPLLSVWVVYASGVLYLKYVFRFGLHGTAEDVGVVFLFIFVMSFLILMSCAVVLDAIRQIETGHPSFTKAIRKAVREDLVRVLPVSFVWAILWMVLTVIEALLSKSRDNGSAGNDTLTAESAAETIANYHSFSFSEAFIDALKKGIRMVMFLIVPAIAWENLGAFQAMKKGLAVLRAHLGLFGSGYALTYAAAAIVFLPSAVIFELGTGRHGNPPLIHFPSAVWVATIIYMGLAWSFTVYLEQMFMAQVYLWYLKWEKAVAQAKKAGQPVPAFTSIPRPELLEKTPGLFA